MQSKCFPLQPQLRLLSANCHRNIGPQDDVMVLPAWFVPDNHAPMAMISTMREGSFSVV
jgi:hypothetical protein